MKIVVTANGTHLDAPISPVFGRCPTHIFVDTTTLAFEAVENPVISASAGAGIQAAQFIIERGAQVLLTGSIGPNAAVALQGTDMQVYQIFEGTVRQAVEMFQQGRLNPISGANVPSHSGMRGGSWYGHGAWHGPRRLWTRYPTQSTRATARCAGLEPRRNRCPATDGRRTTSAIE